MTTNDGPAVPRAALRPNYLYSGGNVLMHPPLMLGSSEMYGFFVKGERDALQRTVDETLNAASAGQMPQTISAACTATVIVSRQRSVLTCWSAVAASRRGAPAPARPGDRAAPGTRGRWPPTSSSTC